MSRQNILAIMRIFAVCVFLGILGYWHLMLHPGLVYDKTMKFQMALLSSAVGEFNGKFGRLPTNIQEMVVARVLPKKGGIYYCPLRHDSLWTQELLYTECEYKMTFLANAVRIAISPDLNLGMRYGFVAEEKQSLILNNKYKVKILSRGPGWGELQDSRYSMSQEW